MRQATYDATDQASVIELPNWRTISNPSFLLRHRVIQAGFVAKRNVCIYR